MPDYRIRLIETREISFLVEGRDREAALRLARRACREAPQLAANIYQVEQAMLRAHPISIEAIDAGAMRQPDRHHPLEAMLCARRG